VALSLKNLLLDCYRLETGQDLTSRCEAVALPIHTVLYQPGSRPRYIHFLTSGLASIVCIMQGGEGVEVGMVGQESFPEALHLMGPQMTARQGIMQVGGTALRMRFKDFEEEFVKNTALRNLVMRSVQYEAMTLSQLVACNALHLVEERLARWLLMVQSRTGERDLPLTQEFLGQMLGARRSSVTLAAGNLQRSGMIEYRRGNIRIESRERLEETACECAAIIQDLFENIYR
jgi:CRP-like cAMP-binding protein